MRISRFAAATSGLAVVMLLAVQPGVSYGQADTQASPPQVEQRQQPRGQAAEPGELAPPSRGPARQGLSERQRTLLHELGDAIHTIASSVENSVVHIEVTDTGEDRQEGDNRQRRRPGRPQPRIPDEFRDELRRRIPGFEWPEPQEEAQEPIRRGLGSGIVFDNQGHILTNNHVVSGADQIRVVTTDGRSFDATIVGTDELTDVAVIKVKNNNLQPAQFGDSSKIEVGDIAFAMGNPFGLDYSVTMGIISAKGRRGLQLGSIYYQNFLQTDAAINPGNSGGPLVNTDGQVIGLNTAIATSTGQYAGVGFAIPSEQAVRIAKVLIAEGKVTRGWLGVKIEELTPDFARSFNFPRDRKGVLIQDVIPNSPAAEAGFQRGDIVTEVNSQAVSNPNELQNIITFLPPGEKVNFRVWRDGKTINVEATLQELQPEYLQTFGGEEGQEEARPGRPQRYRSEELGITAVTPSQDLARQYGWSRTPSGAMVVEVTPTGEAANIGIRPGNVIESVNNQSIESVADLREAMENVSIEEGFRMYVRDQRAGGRYIWVQRQ